MPDINYLPYRRQFYIGPQPKLMDDSWQSCTLQNGLALSYSNYLPVQFVTGRNQWFFVLMGDAVESLPGKPDVVTSLQELSDIKSLPQVYASWAGRWVLIANHELHLDASGLLGCYFRIKERLEVASVAGFIANAEKPDTFPLVKAGGAEFYPPPNSGFTHVSKLLPSQVLNLQTGNISVRNLQVPVPRLTYQESIEYLARLLTTTLKNLYVQNSSKKLLLALTGGFDSRVLMAALNFAKLPYEAITFHYSNIRPSDASIPKQLSQLCGIRHRLIRANRRNPKNWELYNQHTCGHSVETDRYYMLFQQFDELEGGQSLLLRGGGFEVGRCAYYPWLPVQRINGAAISAIQKGNELQGQSWDRWLEWVNKTPEIRLDWRDRYYIEQRLAGWLSCTEQALDIVNIDRQVPANSTLFFNVMLNIPEEIRKTKVQMKDLIHYLDPKLLQLPINPPVSFYYKQYRRVLFKINKIREKLNWV